jgi:DNA-binding transcriptional MerR regulator
LVELMNIGEIAKRTGLTVRALRHYEELGLLSPPRRTEGGQRRYGIRELERLRRIVALRQLGFGLAEIGSMLDRPNASPLNVLEARVAQIGIQLADLARLRERLCGIADQIRAGESETMADMMKTLEMMAMVERHYTPEQLDWLARRREEVGQARIKQVEAEWTRLIDEVVAAIDAGIPAHDPRALALAERWTGLVQEFSSGNQEIESAVQRVWDEDGDRLIEQHGMNPRMTECAAYVNEALADSGRS